MSQIDWSVRVDWTPGHTYTESELDDLLDALGPMRPSIGVDHAGDAPAYSAMVSVEAATMRQAMSTALQQVEAATGVRASGLEVMSHAELERQLNRPTIPPLVGHAEIAEMLGVSRQRAAQLADRADFPPAVVTVKAGPLRVRDQVESWAAAWSRKGGRPRKETTGATS
jgi:hypothetical protein